jgi:hypothetical protein
VKKHDLETAWNWYIDDEFQGGINSDQKMPGNPRWRIDALRRRGVSLKNFKLV